MTRRGSGGTRSANGKSLETTKEELVTDTAAAGGRGPQQDTIRLIASGDLRLSANQVCWPAQRDMEQTLAAAIEKQGYRLERAHPFKDDQQHGFIASQREGIETFKSIPTDAPLIVAEAVWQYSHHVLAGLTTHRGPILTVANWSGQWPGLVGMLNLNGSLTKAGVSYTTLVERELHRRVLHFEARPMAEVGQLRTRYEPRPNAGSGCLRAARSESSARNWPNG